MKTAIKFKSAALVGMVMLGLGALEATASQPVEGVCRTDFPLTKMMHLATPEFLEDIRQRSNSTTVRVLKPNQVITFVYLSKRLNVYVDENNMMIKYSCF